MDYIIGVPLRHLLFRRFAFMTYPFISVAIVLLSHCLLCLFPRLFLLSVALPTCTTFIGLVITHGYFTLCHDVHAAIFPLELFVVSTSPPCPLPPYGPTPACQQHAPKLIFLLTMHPVLIQNPISGLHASFAFATLFT